MQRSIRFLRRSGTGRVLPSDEVIGLDDRDPLSAEQELGDFTTTWSTVRLVPLAVVVGVLSAGVALALLKLIALCTSIAYYGDWGTDHTSPLGHSLGWMAVGIPVVGGLLVGLMARYGSERIRGHGIPEAMETILVGGSKSQPRVAVLKPISSAISIGSGGPFGAEGPIILTGGAVGSVLSQFFHLTAIERRSLLVAGAAGGMSAVFGTPVAAVLLGVELLVFEWRPRSMVLIVISSSVAAGMRLVFVEHGLLDSAPLFPTALGLSPGMATFAGGLAIGLVGGCAAWVLTKAVYAAEDAFKHLPIHWVWWPAIGGLVIGLGGLVEPRALGVGYETISAEITGGLAAKTLLAVLIVKLIIWSVALGSGTSGGILAPILMMGAAAGGLIGPLLPGGSVGTWSLLGMAACLAGVTRSPFTATIFALELTHDIDMLLPLLIACTIAHFVSVLILKRSILTEKVARRGFHVLREYSVDALDALFVRDVMETEVVTLEPDRTLAEIHASVEQRSAARQQRLLPVIDANGHLLGGIPWVDVLEQVASGDGKGTVADAMVRNLVVAFPDETLRTVADRMSQRQVGVLPVVERGRPDKLRGIVTQFDLLAARERILLEERHRERVLSLTSLPRMVRSRLRPLTDSSTPVADDGLDREP